MFYLGKVIRQMPLIISALGNLIMKFKLLQEFMYLKYVVEIHEKWKITSL